MDIEIEHLASLTWIWHDAEIRSLTTRWSAEDCPSITLACSMNPYEDLSALRELGFLDLNIEILFDIVLYSTLVVQGFYSSGEVLSSWDILASSPLLEQEKKAWGELGQNSAIRHHHFTTSAGSIFDIICLEAKLR
jgi:hypothetical protein